MSPDGFHEFVLGLQGSVYEVKFGDKKTYCVGGRMFTRAGAVTDAQPLYGFKVSELSREILIGQGIARPMPYLHRAGWVQLVAHDALSARELIDYVSDSYWLIVGKLTRAQVRDLGIVMRDPIPPFFNIGQDGRTAATMLE